MDKTNERRQFHAWLLDQEKSSNTTASYDYALKAFFERHDSVDRQAVLDFKNELLMQGFSPKTVNLRLSGIEAYCKMKGIDVQIKHLRAQKSSSVENVISADDYQKLLNELCESEDLRGHDRSAAHRSAVWIQFKFAEPTKLSGYRWYTANDDEDRDPRDWRFLGSNDGVNWVVVDKVEDFEATSDRKTLAFTAHL